MSPYLILLILCAVSALLLALICFSPRAGRIGTGLCLAWLAAALPVMYFLDIERKGILLFYLVSAAIGLVFMTGGKER